MQASRTCAPLCRAELIRKHATSFLTSSTATKVQGVKNCILPPTAHTLPCHCLFAAVSHVNDVVVFWAKIRTILLLHTTRIFAPAAVHDSAVVRRKKFATRNSIAPTLDCPHSAPTRLTWRARQMRPARGKTHSFLRQHTKSIGAILTPSRSVQAKIHSLCVHTYVFHCA